MGLCIAIHWIRELNVSGATRQRMSDHTAENKRNLFVRLLLPP